MRRAQNGDSEAYSELLCEVAPLIRSFIFKRLGEGSENEDLLQEVLLAIHRSGHTYNTERPFKNWMFAIADFKVKDYLRAYYKKQSRPECDLENIDISCVDVTKAPSANELLNDILDDLPERQRQIVRMMKLEGYSLREVSEVTEMSVSAVKVAAHRAYKALIANGSKRRGS